MKNSDWQLVLADIFRKSDYKRLLETWLLTTALLLFLRFFQKLFSNPGVLPNLVSMGVLLNSSIWLLMAPLFWKILKKQPSKPTIVFILKHFAIAISLSILNSVLFLFIHNLIWPNVISTSDILAPYYLVADLRINLLFYVFFFASARLKVAYREKSISVSDSNEYLIIKNTLASKVRISKERVIFIQSMGNYLHIWENTEQGLQEHLVRRSLGNIMNEFLSKDFMRVQKSFIVNRQHISATKKGEHGEHILIMKSGKLISTSRIKKDEITTWLGQLSS